MESIEARKKLCEEEGGKERVVGRKGRTGNERELELEGKGMRGGKKGIRRFGKGV